MENASKALLMAGGILIALMILSLIVYLSTSMTRVANAQDEIKESNQISEFNKAYEAYNKSLMYGSDVVTVVNKAEDYNSRLELESSAKEFYIRVNVINKDGNAINKDDLFTNYKTEIFKCSKIGYSNTTGKVNLMEFNQINKEN